MTATARYTPGDDVAVVHDRAWALLPASAAATAAPLWEAGAAGQARVTAVVEVLTAHLGLDLATLPGFAAVTVDADREAHVLVRGEFRVRCETADGPVDVEGAGVFTWQERRVAGVTAVRLDRADAPGTTGTSGTGGTQDGVAGPWPVRQGVVRAAAVTAGLDGDVAPDRVEVADVPAARPDPSATSSVSSVPSVPSVPPAPPQDGAVVPEPERPTLVGVAETFAPAVETVLPEPEDPARGDAEPAPAADENADVPEVVPSAPDAPDDARAEAADDEPAIAGYTHLWGETIARSVEDAAVRLAEEDEHDVPEPAGDAAPAAPAAPDAVDAPVDPAATVAPDVADLVVDPARAPVDAAPGLISGVPRTWGIGTPGTPVPAGGAGGGATPGAPDDAAADGAGGAADWADDEAADDDHDGHTVMGSQIAALRAQAVAQPGLAGPAPADAAPAQPGAASGGGPQVLARVCPSGHANPPSRDDCRECGATLEGDAAPAPRPPLGQVRVSDGSALPLDRPLVVGRRPRSPRGAASELPRLVTVPSPQNDVSRSHVSVQLEGWHVLASDLATTNGTVLLRPGQAPQRLHPNEPTLLADGDVVDLGDGVTLSFEGLW